MVDLVKIRKKAKKKAEEGEQAAAGNRASEALPLEEAPVISPPRQNADDQHVEQHVDQHVPPLAPAPDDAHHSELGTEDVQAPPELSTKLDRFKEEAGRRREDFVAAEAVAEGAEQLELLTFHIAGEQYAVDIEHIVEIVPPRDATRVPNAHQSIVGIISLRGTIVTVVDVRQTLRHPPSGVHGPDARVVVVQYGGETLGFEVDRVVRVVKVDRTAVEPHPIVHSSEQSEAIRGVFRHANALTILLDFDKLLAARHGTYL
jgi:purine-binding chemotaxis protein CheW